MWGEVIATWAIKKKVRRPSEIQISASVSDVLHAAGVEWKPQKKILFSIKSVINAIIPKFGLMLV